MSIVQPSPDDFKRYAVNPLQTDKYDLWLDYVKQQGDLLWTPQNLWTPQKQESYDDPLYWDDVYSFYQFKKEKKKPKYKRALKLKTRKSTIALKGFRCWSLTDGKLASTGNGKAVWEGPVLIADGKPENRQPPGANGFGGGEGAWNAKQHGYHGIYAYKSVKYWYPKPKEQKTSGSTSYISFSQDWQQEYIHGILDLLGKVVVHQDGFRAEKAVIQFLYVPMKLLYNDRTLPKRLEDRYHCEVTTDCAKYLEEAENGNWEGS